MKEALKRLRIYSLVFFLVELLVVALFTIFYFANAFGIRDFFDDGNVAVLFIILASIILLNVVNVIVILGKIYSVRQNSDLKAAELIGSDVQEAYNFGMLGLVVVDEKDTVIWVNQLIRDRQLKILDLNIFDWQPRLKELTVSNADESIKLKIDSKDYEIKYLSDAGLFIFKDTSEYEDLNLHYTKEAMVLGIIMIDNYTDDVITVNEVNDIISQAKNAILEYCKRFNVFLRSYKSNAYYAICDYDSLERMKNDNFSLLEKVRNINPTMENPPTLSIAFAHGFPDVTKLNEMTNTAIDMALSRGGDQAIVSKHGEELLFYGGKTAAAEKRNTVRVRTMADTLMNLIKDSTNVIIMGHTDMDMDALGSCLGVKAMCDHLSIPSKVVYDPKLTEKKTRYAITDTFTNEEVKNIMCLPRDAVELTKSNTLVIVCDTSAPSLVMAPKVIEKAPKIAIIDHHRLAEISIENPVFRFIEPSASSASELVTDLIGFATANPKIDIPSKFATVMLSGIFLDSNFFKSKSCGIRTFEASMILKENGADNTQADNFLKDEFEEYSLITGIISNMETYRQGIVYCCANSEDIIEKATLSKVANQCMQMKDVKACFVIGNSEDKETRISARSDGSINVQLLAEKMGGGGHFTSAAVSFKNSSVDKVKEKLLETLNNYLTQAVDVMPEGETQQ